MKTLVDFNTRPLWWTTGTIRSIHMDALVKVRGPFVETSCVFQYIKIHNVS